MGEVVRSNPRRRRLGARLRKLRERAGLSIAQAAPKLDFSPSKLSRIENGEQQIDVHWVRSMLDLYDAAEDWGRLLDQARRSNDRGWWLAYGSEGKGYVGQEADACLVRNFELAYIPGLLQTDNYARAIFQAGLTRQTSAEIDKLVTVRMRRQRRLTDEDDPLALHAIIDEAALCRPAVDEELMATQLRRIVEMARLPTVTVQILPTSVGVHPGMEGAFTILSFPDKGDHNLVYIPHVAGSLHLQQDSDLRACSLTFDHLRSKALSPGDSIAFIERVAGEP